MREDDMTPERDFRSKLFVVLQDILENHPAGLKEYDLLVILKERGIPLFSDANFSDTLALFKAHFMLFHLLYSMREYLQKEQKATIEIHFLRIILLPWQSNERHLPGVRGSLAEYYGNLANMEEMAQVDVDAMIDQFWQDYIAYQAKPESYSLLGLEPNATRSEIKQRYRDLAKDHHPDRGGNSLEFKRISDAAQILLR